MIKIEEVSVRLPLRRRCLLKYWLIEIEYIFYVFMFFILSKQRKIPEWIYHTMVTALR